MGRPALRGSLPKHVSASLMALAGCATTPPPSTAAARGADLPPPTRSVDGLTVAVVGDHRPAVEALLASYREALEQRDPARLRSLFAPTLGGLDAPGPGMSREAWLTRAEAIFAAAARGRAQLQSAPRMDSYAVCAPSCPSARMAPGEWLVRWPGLAVRGRPGLPSDLVLPWALRVAVVEGEAVVVGVDDELVTPLGPATVRLSGAGRP